MQYIALSVKTEKERKKERKKERRKHSNNSCRVRLRIHKAHLRPFDNQTLASYKILHLSVKTETERKAETQ